MLAGNPHTLERINKRRIVKNGKELNAVFVDILSSTDETIRDLTRQAAITLYTKCAVGTPVKTTRARWGWMLTEVPTNAVPNEAKFKDADKNESLESLKQNARAHEDEIISAVASQPAATIYYVTNNVQYIMRLEAGHSKAQAPRGWIATSLVETRKELQNTIKARFK
jgi:hypothetical protein|uniref:Uncharacterized protein n=1 Tax=Siphoviridae sp. ctwHj1 TaxID=2825727 RepID=A0A8S5U6C0_9CAUD|nr:MAG TPA: hypothetical protein [Siphoviridae sp. ctwHj1]